MTDHGPQSTTDEVLDGIDLTGRRALVTGVSAGLGVETARALLAHGAEVIGAARNLTKAEEATQAIPAEDRKRLTFVELDLASLASVRACADAIGRNGEPIDLAIANAGIMATPFARTADGFEIQFGTNHLGHFVLMNRIAPLMPSGARLVSLTSSAHQFSDVDLADPNYEQRAYNTFQAYGASKTANALFAVEFDRRHKGRGVRATAVHPGAIMTELIRHMDQEAITQMSAMSMAEWDGEREMFLKTVAQGAATSLWAGVAAPDDLVGGRYCEDCGVAEVHEKGGEGVRPYAMDPEHAREVWSLSEMLVDESFAL